MGKLFSPRSLPTMVLRQIPWQTKAIALLGSGLLFAVWLAFGEDGRAQSISSPPPGMVRVPEGWFIMGSDHWDNDERPQRKVYLKAFYIDRYEVTNRQYRAFDPSHRFPPGREDHPVVNVSWHEANAYASWVGKRMPTEEEWEKAARGTDRRTYPWGEEYVQGICNTYQTNRWATAPVGFFAGDVSPYGVYDMVGNVMEWASSLYLPYPGNENDHNEDFQKGFRVVRGSSWDGDFYCYGRAAYRNFAPPEGRYPSLGFRCAKDVEK